MYTDDNGIVRFESTDNISPLHIGLNTALGSVSDAIGAVQDEVSNYVPEKISDGTRTLEFTGDGLLASGGSTRTVFRIESAAYTDIDLPVAGGDSGGFVRVNNSGVMYLYAGPDKTSDSTIIRMTPYGDLPVQVAPAGTANYFPIPRVASGRITITGTGSSNASITVSLPTGRFTETPVVTATSENSNYNAYVVPGGTSSTSIRIGLRHLTGANWGSSVGIQWTAIQA